MKSFKIFLPILIIQLGLACFLLSKRDIPKQAETIGEPLITLTGKLGLRFFPDMATIEDLGGPTTFPSFILELDKPSFLLALNTPVGEFSQDLEGILRHPHANELSIGTDMSAIYEKFKDQKVAITGYLFHAHTHHHRRPLLMNVQQVVSLGIVKK